MYSCPCAQCNGTLEPNYPEDCPDTCRSKQNVHVECGSTRACKCFPRTLLGRLCMWLVGPCGIEEDPECDCPAPAEIRAEREERRAEARSDK